MLDQLNPGSTCTKVTFLANLVHMAHRVESEHTVTASNLFKYCEPCHGLVLFKHHHPLQFSQQQVSELLNTASEWFRASLALQPEAPYPFFLWNCLSRAGLLPILISTLYHLCHVCQVGK